MLRTSFAVLGLLLLVILGRETASAEEEMVDVFGYTFIRDQNPGFFVHPEPMSEAFSPKLEVLSGKFAPNSPVDRSPDSLLLLRKDRLEGEWLTFHEFGILFTRLPLRFEPQRDVRPNTYWILEADPANNQPHERLVVLFEDGVMLQYSHVPSGITTQYRGYETGVFQLLGQALAEFPASLTPYSQTRRADAKDLFLTSPSRQELYRISAESKVSRLANPCSSEAEPYFLDLDRNGHSEVLCTFHALNSSLREVRRVYQYQDAWKNMPALQEQVSAYSFTEFAVLDTPTEPLLLGRTATTLLAFSISSGTQGAVKEITSIDSAEDFSILRRSDGSEPQVSLLLHNSENRQVRHFIYSAGSFLEQKGFLLPVGFARTGFIPGEFRYPGVEQLLFFRPQDGRFALTSIAAPIPFPGVRLAAGDDNVFYTGWRGHFHSWVSKSQLPALQASLVGQQFQRLPTQFNWLPNSHTVNFETVVDSSTRESAAGICNGFNWNTLHWGSTPNGSRLHACAHDQIVVGADDEIRHYNLDCCGLPLEDMLVDQWQAVTERCPEDYVFVGPVRETTLAVDVIYPPKLSCRKINTERYQLGPEHPGVYWGTGHTARRTGKQIIHSRLPAAVRFGIGRNDIRTFGVDGCVGEPVGAAMVAKQGKHCDDMRFREIQFRGIGEDPPQGTPVRLFASCHEISSAFEPSPRCLK